MESCRYSEWAMRITKVHTISSECMFRLIAKQINRQLLMAFLINEEILNLWIPKWIYCVRLSCVLCVCSVWLIRYVHNYCVSWWFSVCTCHFGKLHALISSSCIKCNTFLVASRFIVPNHGKMLANDDGRWYYQVYNSHSSGERFESIIFT